MQLRDRGAMYFNTLGVRVVVKEGDWLLNAEPVEQWTAQVPAEQFELPDGNAFLSELQRFVFAEADQPYAYSVTLSVQRLEQGGSAALGEVLIELISQAKTASWAVLAELVAAWLYDRIKSGD